MIGLLEIEATNDSCIPLSLESRRTAISNANYLSSSTVDLEHAAHYRRYDTTRRASILAVITGFLEHAARYRRYDTTRRASMLAVITGFCYKVHR
jgi:hypothetical protein